MCYIHHLHTAAAVNRHSKSEYKHVLANILRSRYNTPGVWTKWNGLVADNIAHAVGASIISLARGVFAGMRSACSERWAWRITAGLCHSFLVLP